MLTAGGDNGNDNDNEDVALQKPMKTVVKMRGQTGEAKQKHTDTVRERCVCVCVLTMGSRTAELATKSE